jgi:hypothetical protein
MILSAAIWDGVSSLLEAQVVPQVELCHTNVTLRNDNNANHSK